MTGVEKKSHVSKDKTFYDKAPSVKKIMLALQTKLSEGKKYTELYNHLIFFLVICSLCVCVCVCVCFFFFFLGEKYLIEKIN